MNMQALMAQAQRVQKDIMKKKDELNKKEFEGESELVKVVVNGNRTVLSVTYKNIDSLEKDDLEVLQDMTVIAMNDALKKVDAATDEVMGQYGGGLTGLF